MNSKSLYTLLNILIVVESEVNIFYKLNEEMQAIINSLFFSLGINQHLYRFENIQYMLDIHYKFRNISEIIIELLQIAKDLHKKNFQYKNKDDFIKTEQTINELINNDSLLSNYTTFNNIGEIIDSNLEKTISNATKNNKFNFRLVNELVNKNYDNFKKSEEDTNELNAIIDTSEPMVFIEDFMKKINNLTVNDFIQQVDNTSLKETRRYLQNQYYDLKIWRDTYTRRIYKGKSTSILEYPFIASVHVKEEFSCTGSIISRNFILTSASCLHLIYKRRSKPANLPSVSARIGSDYISKNGQVIEIVTIFFHPNYKPLYFKNNIAILKMEEHTYLRRNRRIKRIEFDNKNKKILDSSERVTFLSWGSRYKNIAHVPISFAILSIFNHDMCKNVYSSEYVTVKNFCAGFEFKGDGACDNDVGGPAIVDGVLVGMVSFGPALCGISNSPTVFIKLSCYHQWIQSIIQEEAKNASSSYNKYYFKNGDKKNNKNTYKTSNELDGNYNFYTVESDSSEGLSIEIAEVKRTTKEAQVSRMDKKANYINSNEKKEKIIEGYYINILENILDVSTRNNYKNILRQGQMNTPSVFKTKTSHAIYKHKKQNSRFTTKSWKRGNKITTSTKGLKLFNIYNVIMDYFKQNLNIT